MNQEILFSTGECVPCIVLVARNERGVCAILSGDACAANALAVTVPCHRVVREDGGGLAGYHRGVARKRALPEREGARVACADLLGNER